MANGESLPDFKTDELEPATARASIKRGVAGKLEYKLTVGISDSEAAVKMMRVTTLEQFKEFEEEIAGYEAYRANTGKGA